MKMQIKCRCLNKQLEKGKYQDYFKWEDIVIECGDSIEILKMNGNQLAVKTNGTQYRRISPRSIVFEVVEEEHKKEQKWWRKF